MKKFAKMSLVAAVAVAGMTTANAKDLTEAIKGVDVSGTVVYRYNDYSNGDASSSTSNNYKIGLSLSSKVNEDIKVNTRFLVANGSGNFVSLDTGNNGDANVDVTLSQVNFAYSGIQNTTVIVGKQGLATPWTNAIDSDGSEQTGSGILGLTTWGPVTAAAGYFNQTNLDTTKVHVNGTDYNVSKDGAADGVGTNTRGNANTVVAALIAKFGPVAAEAWYLDIDEVADTYFVKASAGFDVDSTKLNVFAQYNDMEIDDSLLPNNNHDLNLLKAGVSAKMGMFNAAFTYGKSGDEGTGVINAVAKNGMIGWNVSLHDQRDAEMYQIDLGMQVTPKLHVGLNYDALDTNSRNVDETEMYVQTTYNMSKNLMTYVRFGNYELENQNPEEDGLRGRLQVQYSF